MWVPVNRMRFRVVSVVVCIVEFDGVGSPGRIYIMNDGGPPGIKTRIVDRLLVVSCAASYGNRETEWINVV